MKKELILGLAFLASSTVNAMDVNHTIETMGQYNNTPYSSSHRTIVDQGGPARMPKPNEERLKQAEKVIENYLKQSHDDSLSTAQKQQVLNILGNRTVCPPGSYKKTCGQLSCTETEVTGLCLTHKGTFKKAAHSVKLKPHEQLVNVNGVLKTESCINVPAGPYYSSYYQTANDIAQKDCPRVCAKQPAHKYFHGAWHSEDGYKSFCYCCKKPNPANKKQPKHRSKNHKKQPKSTPTPAPASITSTQSQWVRDYQN